VSRYQKDKTNLEWDFTEARDSEWQWHQLGRMQVCTSLQIDNHASTPTTQFLTTQQIISKIMDMFPVTIFITAFFFW